MECRQDEEGRVRSRCLTLYHGSYDVVTHPDVTRNTGFSDLGRGFYLTDDRGAAIERARSRARREGTPTGVVSAFEFDEGCVPWASWGTGHPALRRGDHGMPFGLRFDADAAGVRAWIAHVMRCRGGSVEAADLGIPAVVRAWIATEEVELACSGLVAIDEVAPLLAPDELIVQYCLLDQALVDRALVYVGAERVGA